MIRCRYAIALSTAVTAVLTLSACGAEGGRASDDRKPPQGTPSVTSAGPHSSAPSGSKPPSGAGHSDDPAVPSEMMPIYKTVYGVSGPPACNDVSWDDAGCGEDLTAARDVANAMSRRIEKHFPDGEYADVKKAAGRVDQAVNTLRKLGCYRLSPEPPKTDPAKLRELCPTLGTVAALSWLGFESSVSAF